MQPTQEEPTMRNENRDHAGSSNRPLADQLRTTLHAARGNMEIRERLRSIADDPARLDPIIHELGPRHALIRELLLLTGRRESAKERAA